MEYLGAFKVHEPGEWLDLALSCKKNTVDDLKALEDSLRLEFSKYDGLIASSHLKPRESEFSDHKELLVEYYDHAPADLKRLIIERRRNHGLLMCPFCGSPAEPDTLDHFIPKDHWPEFSINPNNLVPQCRGCAPTKGASYYSDEVCDSLYVHPIYSDILSQFKFKIKVEFNERSFSYRFRLSLICSENVDEVSRVRVIRHFKELSLKSRVQEYCYREVKRWKCKLSSNSFDVEVALRARLDEWSENDQCGDWKTALYIGMLENQKFIGYINSFGEKVGREDDDAISSIELEIQ